MAAVTSLVAACTHAPRSPEPEHLGALAPVEPETPPDSISEAEIRAFLAAEFEDRRADRAADSTVTRDGVEAGERPFVIDQADFDLPIVMNERVEFWMEYFQTRGRERFSTYLTRMGRYEEMIRSELRARGMPEDLIYLALIESGFSTSATSRASAVGVWQFMAPTARSYRLEISRFVDERRDPYRATAAALAYLEFLYEKFGSWYLAAAGYNSGENRVERLLQRHVDGARGDDEFFWRISPHLPSETRNYVPKLIAAAILGKYRDRYGFGDIVPEEPIPFDLVAVPDATELGVIARAAGAEEGVIKALNPQFLRGVTPPRREVEVRVPAGSAETFRVAYARIPPSERVTKVEHVVARGETLSGIAKRYRTTVAAIQETNGIRNPHSIRVGTRLVIDYGMSRRTASSTPARTSAGTATARKSSSGTTSGERVLTYRVREGDSLWSIAREHGVAIADLRAWNNLSGSRIVPGQELRIGARGVIRYRIQRGDTLWAIAQRHGISPDRLMQWNRLEAGAVIRPGQELEVPVAR